MVAHYFGSDINQHSIIDVLRTSDVVGTSSYDLVRGAHFSYLSAAPKQYKMMFPSFAPQQGWNRERYFGYASFVHRNSSNCYVEDLTRILADDIPIIALMKYDDKGEGHYRVVIGYELTENGYDMILLDPWDRDDNSREQRYNQKKFCDYWDFSEDDNTPSNIVFSKRNYKSEKASTGESHVAAIMYPLKVDLSYTFDAEYKVSTQNGSNIVITANIEYPCYAPFCVPNADATYETVAYLATPDKVNVTHGNKKVQINEFGPGKKFTCEWKAYVQDQDDMYIRTQQISFQVQATIHTSVPPARYDDKNTSPGYDYTDVIGGFASVHV
jgi:hypothetical protein